MAIHRFTCPNCQKSLKKFLHRDKVDSFSPTCECGTSMKRELGLPDALEMETKDEYRNKRVIAGTNEKLDARAREHFERHTLPRIIDEHGREFARRQGWLKDENEPK
jgi:thymidine kinase